MIEQGLSLNKASQLSGISKTALYYKPKPRFVAPKPENVELVKQYCMLKPAYGYRRITAMLRRNKIKINRKQVHRIMRLNSWLKPFHKRHCIRTGKTLLQPIASNQYWQADMIKVWCGQDGWGYLFNVLDCYDRQWIGYNFSLTCSTADNEPSVTMALQNRAPQTMQLQGLIFHSDNGTQFTSQRFEAFLKHSGFVHITSRKKTPEDAAYIESFHSTLRTEYLWLYEFENFQQALQVIQLAFIDYNNERIHSSLDYKTPNEFYTEALKKVSLNLC